MWVDPALKPVGEWYCHGWRNHRSAAADALTGVARGKLPPVPSPADALALACTAATTGGPLAQPSALSEEGLATARGAGGALLQVCMQRVDVLNGIRRITLVPRPPLLLS